MVNGLFIDFFMNGLVCIYKCGCLSLSFLFFPARTHLSLMACLYNACKAKLCWDVGTPCYIIIWTLMVKEECKQKSGGVWRLKMLLIRSVPGLRIYHALQVYLTFVLSCFFHGTSTALFHSEYKSEWWTKSQGPRTSGDFEKKLSPGPSAYFSVSVQMLSSGMFMFGESSSHKIGRNSKQPSHCHSGIIFWSNYEAWEHPRRGFWWFLPNFTKNLRCAVQSLESHPEPQCSLMWCGPWIWKQGRYDRFGLPHKNPETWYIQSEAVTVLTMGKVQLGLDKMFS